MITPRILRRSVLVAGEICLLLLVIVTLFPFLPPVLVWVGIVACMLAYQLLTNIRLPHRGRRSGG